MIIDNEKAFIKRQLQIILGKTSFDLNKNILISPLIVDLEELLNYIKDDLSEKTRNEFYDCIYSLDELLGMVSLEEINHFNREEVILIEKALNKIRELVITSDLWMLVEDID
jgi:hypothetical protein